MSEVEKTVKKTVKKVIGEVLGIKKESLSENSHLTADLGADEYDCSEIVLRLEDSLKITIPDQICEKCFSISSPEATVGNIIQQIESLVEKLILEEASKPQPRHP